MFNKQVWVNEGLALRTRSCVICNENFLARNRQSRSLLCPKCNTPKLRKEEVRLKAQISRAEQAGLPATLTISEWFHILNHFNWRCAYCKRDHHQLMDHVIAVVDGGGTIASNVVPCCVACNCHKDRKYPYHGSNMSMDIIESVKRELMHCLSSLQTTQQPST